jgi:hypothetical protein
MLNMFTNKQNTSNDLSLKTNYGLDTIKNKNIKTHNKSDRDEYNNIIYYPSSSKEWFSSVYSYNKSYSKSLIVFDLLSNKLFSSYFNMFRDKTKILFKRRRDNKSRYSANKIYVSRAELKHSNTKLLILLSTYNKQKSTLLRWSRKILFLSRIYKILSEGKDSYVVKYKRIFTTYLKSMTHKSRIKIVKYRKNGQNTIKRYIPAYINRLNHKGNLVFKRKLRLFRKWHKLFLTKNKNILTNFLLTIKNKILYKVPRQYNWLLRKNFRVVKMLFKNTRLISFNKAKFNNFFLSLRNLGLIHLIGKIYGKKTKIKLVDLKSIHLNSDVFSSAVALKLRDRKNKAVRVLRKAILQMVKIPDLHTLITFDDKMETMNKNNILNTIKQQVVSGVRFEASGRLTRRLTAMRAVFKYRYVGSLKNLRSSFNNRASTLLRGFSKANSQYTLINSKTRNGTFGLKGWVSSH